MTPKARIGKAERTAKTRHNGAQVIGYCYTETDPDRVTLSGGAGETMTRAEFDRRYPGGTLILVSYAGPKTP